MYLIKMLWRLNKQPLKQTQTMMMITTMTTVTRVTMAIMVMPNIHSSLLCPSCFSKLLHILTALMLIAALEEKCDADTLSSCSGLQSEDFQGKHANPGSLLLEPALQTTNQTTFLTEAHRQTLLRVPWNSSKLSQWITSTIKSIRKYYCTPIFSYWWWRQNSFNVT